MGDLRVSSPSLPLTEGLKQDDSASVVSGVREMEDLLQELPGLLNDTLKSAADLISNPNGAPQLPDSTVDFSSDSLYLALASIQQKLQQSQADTAVTGINSDTKKKEAELQNNLQKIKDWVVKFHDAADKAKAGGILGWCKKIFSAVASALAVVAAALATAATGGAAAPLLAIATLSLVSSIVSIASDIDKAAGGEGFDGVLKYLDPGSLIGMGMGELAKAMGASEEQASIVSTTFAVVTVVAMVVATFIVTGGASVEQALDELSQTIVAASRIGQSAATIVASASQFAESAVDLSAAADRRDAALIVVDQKRIQAILNKLQQQIEAAVADLKKVMAAMQQSMQDVMAIINGNDDNRRQVNSNLTGNNSFI